MANILTYIELEGIEASAASLHALNRARIIATELGATLYALLPCASTPSYDDDDIIAVLSRHGADKVILITHPRLAPPAFFATHGEALKAACRQFPPKLMIFPASATGRELAPRVAVSLSARYAPDASIEQTDAGFVIVRHVFRRRLLLRQPLIEGEGALIMTLSREAPPEVLGDDEAEVVVIHAPAAPSTPLEVLDGQPPDDELAPLARARIVVAGGGGLQTAEDFQLVRDLAQRLGGQAAASHTACERGLAPPELRVGLDGVDLSDVELYLAFGISGSERHLAALGPHTTVVAINTDRAAPICKLANYRIVADARQTLQELLAQGEPARERPAEPEQEQEAGE